MMPYKNTLILVLPLLFTLSLLSFRFFNGTFVETSDVFPGDWPVPLMMIRLKVFSIVVLAAIALLSLIFFFHPGSGIKLFTAILILIMLQFSLSFFALHIVIFELVDLIKQQRNL